MGEQLLQCDKLSVEQAQWVNFGSSEKSPTHWEGTWELPRGGGFWLSSWLGISHMENGRRTIQKRESKKYGIVKQTEELQEVPLEWEKMVEGKWEW